MCLRDSPAVGYGCLDRAVFVIFFKHTVLFASEVASFASEIAVRIIGNFSAFGFALAIIADFFFRAVRKMCIRDIPCQRPSFRQIRAA